MPEVFYAGTNQSTCKRSESKLRDAKYFVAQTVIDVFSPNCLLTEPSRRYFFCNNMFEWLVFITQAISMSRGFFLHNI